MPRDVMTATIESIDTGVSRKIPPSVSTFVSAKIAPVLESMRISRPVVVVRIKHSFFTSAPPSRSPDPCRGSSQEGWASSSDSAWIFEWSSTTTTSGTPC